MIERFERFSLAISSISKNWHKLASDEMNKYGLKGPHAIYLLTLYHYPEGLTAPQLCKLCEKDKADVSRIMSDMKKHELVIKEGSNQNLYRGLYKLTDKGIEAAQNVSRRAALAVEIAGRDLDEDKRAVLYEALEIIAVNLRILSEEGIPEQ